MLYRPGTGIIWIMKNSGGVFSSAYEGSGLGGYELKSGADRVIAFDYEHSGKLDYLVLFRLGTDIIWVVKNNGEGIFTPVYQPSDKDGAPPTEDSNSPTDQTFAFDYNHTGKLDHLVRCKPNTGTMEIWLEPVLDGVVLHYFLHAEPSGVAAWQLAKMNLAKMNHRRRVAGKNMAFEVKRTLEAARPVGVSRLA